MASSLVDVSNLTIALRAFTTERDWHQFHTPKNLAMALIVEAAELLEPFQWLTPDESRGIDPNSDLGHQISEEIADVLIYLVRLSDVMGIDLSRAVTEKFALNAEKYPADRVGGSPAKYSDYESRAPSSSDTPGFPPRDGTFETPS